MHRMGTLALPAGARKGPITLAFYFVKDIRLPFPGKKAIEKGNEMIKIMVQRAANVHTLDDVAQLGVVET
jgi:hypothetical protein